MHDLGVSDTSIAHSISVGRLFPVVRGVFAVGRPGLNGRGRMRAATLACGDESLVSHRTAAALLGLTDCIPTAIDVIAPGDAGRGTGGIRRHHVPLPRGGEAGHCEAIPCTSPSRTIVDLAGVADERELRGFVEEAAVQRCLDPAEIDRILATRRRRGTPCLLRILRDWRPLGSEGEETDGAPVLRSGLEARLLGAIRAAGLPAPRCNEEVAINGKRLTVDFLWPEQRLVVETDGRRFHDHAAAFERDRQRDLILERAGYRTLRVTHKQLARERSAVIATIRGLLDASSGSVVA
jgi:very-short-patch-repair endonuclease